MANKRKLSEGILTNDPSLRWSAYGKWELVYSDVHQEPMRFVCYDQDRIRLATVNGMAELPDLVEQHQIRRLSVQEERPSLDEAGRQGILAALRSRHQKT